MRERSARVSQAEKHVAQVNIMRDRIVSTLEPDGSVRGGIDCRRESVAKVRVWWK